MKDFNSLLAGQSTEVMKLRKIVEDIVEQKIVPDESVSGVLLTGSLARGDARTGPFGIMIDIALTAPDLSEIDLDRLFGADTEPDIPYHCVSIENNIGLAVELIEDAELWKIRERDEPLIFAMNESVILYDRTGVLNRWKKDCFNISRQQIEDRALKFLRRFRYLTGEYRFEKWSSRDAWTQVAQIFNEANECYCKFLYCINGWFIPRNDWLVYLTYDLKIKPGVHSYIIERIYSSRLDEESMHEKFNIYQELNSWMDEILNGN